MIGDEYGDEEEENADEYGEELPNNVLRGSVTKIKAMPAVTKVRQM